MTVKSGNRHFGVSTEEVTRKAFTRGVRRAAKPMTTAGRRYGAIDWRQHTGMALTSEADALSLRGNLAVAVDNLRASGDTDVNSLSLADA